MQTDEGGITCQDGECAAGIFPLGDFFNNPDEGGFAKAIVEENIDSQFLTPRSELTLKAGVISKPMIPAKRSTHVLPIPSGMHRLRSNARGGCARQHLRLRGVFVRVL